VAALRCWPGALAYITDADDPRALGALVEVVRRADDYCERHLGGPSWVIASKFPIPCFKHGDADDRTLLRREVIAMDRELRPILPPPGAVLDLAAQPIADMPVEA
jgi:hypothetical protein